MGTIDDLSHLVAFLEQSGLRPRIDRTYRGIENVPAAMARLAEGTTRGKTVIEF